jgi:hypothetical protein
LNVVNAVYLRRGAIHVSLRDGKSNGMAMGVIEAREHNAAMAIDHPRIWSAQIVEYLLRTEKYYSVSSNGYDVQSGRGDRAASDHLKVVQNQISGHRAT